MPRGWTTGQHVVGIISKDPDYPVGRLFATQETWVVTHVPHSAAGRNGTDGCFCRSQLTNGRCCQGAHTGRSYWMASRLCKHMEPSWSRQELLMMGSIYNTCSESLCTILSPGTQPVSTQPGPLLDTFIDMSVIDARCSLSCRGDGCTLSLMKIPDLRRSHPP